MARRPLSGTAFLVLAALAAAAGCRGPERAYRPPPPPDFQGREVRFQDTDAFDALLESYLNNQVAVIRVCLDTPTPDWPPRLVAWLRAYQAGGKVRPPAGKGGLTALLWLAAAAESPTEARQLLADALDRADKTAAAVADWWAREAERNRRVDLLRPYLLDAVRDPANDGNYVIVLYNGSYEDRR